MKLNLQSSDFELFGVPEQFHLSGVDLDKRWKELQREVHPDKFAARGPSAQRIAMQWSVRVNEAYNRLRDPLQRAAYLCERRGAPINAEINTAMPADFLAEQMTWREALDDAHSDQAVDQLAAKLARVRSEILEQIGGLLDTADDAPAAARQVRALMFIERFARDIEARFEQLGQ